MIIYDSTPCFVLLCWLVFWIYIQDGKLKFQCNPDCGKYARERKRKGRKRPDEKENQRKRKEKREKKKAGVHTSRPGDRCDTRIRCQAGDTPAYDDGEKKERQKEAKIDLHFLIESGILIAVLLGPRGVSQAPSPYASPDHRVRVDVASRAHRPQSLILLSEARRLPWKDTSTGGNTQTEWRRKPQLGVSAHLSSPSDQLPSPFFCNYLTTCTTLSLLRPYDPEPYYYYDGYSGLGQEKENFARARAVLRRAACSRII